MLMQPLPRIEEIAKKRGVSMAQVALAWVMSKDDVTAPIVGTTSLENLKDLLGTCAWVFVYQAATKRIV